MVTLVEMLVMVVVEGPPVPAFRFRFRVGDGKCNDGGGSSMSKELSEGTEEREEESSSCWLLPSGGFTVVMGKEAFAARGTGEAAKDRVRRCEISLLDGDKAWTIFEVSWEMREVRMIRLFT